MSDERRPGNPFDDRRRSNGSRPDGVDMPTSRIRRVQSSDELPIDLVSVQADEELINALAAGTPVGGSTSADDDRMIAMLAAWRDEVDAEPIPELIDVDTAVAAASAPRSRARRRHLAPLVGAAALVFFAGTGVAAAGAQTAQPGDVLWGVAKVFNSERAESVEAAVEVQSRLDRARDAMTAGETAVAAQELQAVESDIATIREQEGQSMLSGEQQRLAAKLRETPPGTPTDPDGPLTSAPGAPPGPIAPDTTAGGGSETVDPRSEGRPGSPDSTTESPPPTTSTPPSTSPTSEGDPDPEPTATREGSAAPDDSEAPSSSAPTTTASGSATAAQSATASGTVSPETSPTTSGESTSGAPTSAGSSGTA